MSQKTKNEEKLLEEKRSSSLEEVLKNALPYHFSNFEKFERQGIPFGMSGGDTGVPIEERMRANILIKFEVQAYINHLRRLKHHIIFLQKQGKINLPTDKELKQVWEDIMLDDGVINLLANKWAVHRSFDDPRGENLGSHLEILLNFEGTVTMWGNGHLFLSLGNHTFYLYHYHLKAMKFVDWFFTEVRKLK